MNDQKAGQQQNSNQKGDTKEVNLKQILGKGGEGVVYKGELDGDDVAVKYQKHLSNTLKKLFRTIKRSQQLRQIQNIVQIKSISLIDNPRVYEIVMELGEQDLHQYLQTPEFQNQSQEEKDELFFQAIKGVRELHDKEFFHRDLKPENFVLEKNEKQIQNLKLIDFGLAKSFDRECFTKGVGSAYYMAPEVQSTIHYNEKVDVWALGLIFYEMLTGETFFDGNKVTDIIQKICQITQPEINDQIKIRVKEQERQKILLETIKIDFKNRISVQELYEQFECMLNKRLQLNEQLNNQSLSLEKNQSWHLVQNFSEQSKLIPLFEIPDLVIINNNQFLMKSPLINMELEVFTRRYFIIYIWKDQQSSKLNNQSQSIIIQSYFQFFGQFVLFFVLFINLEKQINQQKQIDNQLQSDESTQINNQAQKNISFIDSEKMEQENLNKYESQEIEQNNNFQQLSSNQSNFVESVILDSLQNAQNYNQFNQSDIQLSKSEIANKSQFLGSVNSLNHSECFFEKEQSRNGNSLAQSNICLSSSESANNAAYNQSLRHRAYQYYPAESQSSDQESNKQDQTQIKCQVEETDQFLLYSEQSIYSNQLHISEYQIQNQQIDAQNSNNQNQSRENYNLQSEAESQDSQVNQQLVNASTNNQKNQYFTELNVNKQTKKQTFIMEPSLTSEKQSTNLPSMNQQQNSQSIEQNGNSNQNDETNQPIETSQISQKQSTNLPSINQQQNSQSIQQNGNSNQNDQTNQPIQTSQISQKQSTNLPSMNQQQNSQSIEQNGNSNQNDETNQPIETSQISQKQSTNLPSMNHQQNSQSIEQNGNFKQNEASDYTNYFQKQLQNLHLLSLYNFSSSRKNGLNYQNPQYKLYEFYFKFSSAKTIIDLLIYIQQFLIEIKYGKIQIQNLSQIIEKYYQQIQQSIPPDNCLLPYHGLQFYKNMELAHLAEETYNLIFELKFGKITVKNLKQQFEAFCQYFLNTQQQHQISFQQFIVFSKHLNFDTTRYYEAASNFLLELKYCKIVIQNLQQIIEEFYKKLQWIQKLKQLPNTKKNTEDFFQLLYNQFEQNQIYLSFELKYSKIMFKNLFQIIDKNHQMLQYLFILYKFLCIKAKLIDKEFFEFGDKYKIFLKVLQTRELIGKNSEKIFQNTLHSYLYEIKNIQLSIEQQGEKKEEQKSAQKEETIQVPPNTIQTTDVIDSTIPVNINNEIQTTNSQEVNEEQFQQFIRFLIKLNFNDEKISEYIHGDQIVDFQANPDENRESKKNQKLENL